MHIFQSISLKPLTFFLLLASEPVVDVDKLFLFLPRPLPLPVRAGNSKLLALDVEAGENTELESSVLGYEWSMATLSGSNIELE